LHVTTAAILSIGDELVLGQTADTNAAWLSDQLATRGILTAEHRTVGDDRGAVAAAIRELAASAGLLIITGGLGPTADDLTREALGDAAHPGESLVTDDGAIQHLARWFQRRGRTMPASNLRQAQRPRSARFLPNPRGTAPGLAVTLRETLIFALPGPPAEMQPMFLDAVVPHLPRSDDHVILTAAVNAFGFPEAEAAERLGDLMERDRNPLVGTTVSRGILRGRVRSTGSALEARAAMDAAIAAIERAWQPYVFGRDGESLQESAAGLLHRSGRSIAIAESCTGGQLGAMLADVPGISASFIGGWITYSNPMKESQLGVSAELLRQHGAVSVAAAAAMAAGARARSGADIALSITGIAGPEGGTPAKPVGTVFVGLIAGDDRDHPVVRRFQFSGDRASIRDRAAKSALQMLRWSLQGVAEDAPLLFEVRPAAVEAGR
jgi:nicotinamide-nucleotide amidase